MLSDDDMAALQAEEHGLVTFERFRTEEAYVLHLLHRKPYEVAAELARDRRVLDFGCNVGYGSAILDETSRSVTGVDVSAEAIAAAREAFGATGIRFEVIDARGEALAGERFDVVTSFQVIEHIVDAGAYLRRLRGMLAPDGVVVLTSPNARLRIHPGMRPWNRFHVREYAPRELAEVLEGTFEHVALYGLFADEPLASIERKRVGRKRERGRIRQEREGRLGHRILAGLEPLAGLLPLARIKAARKARRKQRQGFLDPGFVERWGTGNLRYRAADLDEALDLFALCSESAGGLVRARALVEGQTGQGPNMTIDTALPRT